MVKLYLKTLSQPPPHLIALTREMLVAMKTVCSPGFTYTGSSPLNQSAPVYHSPLHATDQEPEVSGRRNDTAG